MTEEIKITDEQLRVESEIEALLPDHISTIDIPKRTCIFSCTETDVKLCLKCQQAFCVKHSAKFSPNFCQDCFKSLQVVLDKYTRITDDYDQISNQVIIRKESCNRISIDGPDYIFYTTWINQLSDEELKHVFEFHYFIVKLIEHENETRVIKKKHESVKKLSSSMSLSTSTTTTTQTKKVTKQKDMRVELRKLGLPEDIIDAMIQAGQGVI